MLFVISVGLSVLSIVALLCELLGLSLAYRGMKETWQAHEGSTTTLWDQAVEPYRQIARRVFRRRRNATVHVPAATVGTAIGNPTVIGSASGVVGTDLPDPTTDLAEFGQKVSERIHALNANLDAVSESVFIEKRDRERVVKEVRDDLARVDAETKRLTRSIATEGLPLQLRGWLWVFVGILLGGVSQVGQQVVTGLQSAKEPHPVANHAHPSAPTSAPTPEVSRPSPHCSQG